MQRLAAPVVRAASVHLKAALSLQPAIRPTSIADCALPLPDHEQAMGRHRVRALMRLDGLRPVWRRKFSSTLVHTTDSQHGLVCLACCAQSAVRVSPAPSGVGLRCHLRPYEERLAVLGGSAGLALAQARRLGDGRWHACWSGMCQLCRWRSFRETLRLG
jgi:hypothetical protein